MAADEDGGVLHQLLPLDPGQRTDLLPPHHLSLVHLPSVVLVEYLNIWKFDKITIISSIKSIRILLACWPTDSFPTFSLPLTCASTTKALWWKIWATGYFNIEIFHHIFDTEYLFCLLILVLANYLNSKRIYIFKYWLPLDHKYISREGTAERCCFLVWRMGAGVRQSKK